MNTDQLRAALKAAQETVEHLTELIDEFKPNPDLLNIAVSISNEKEYNQVREVLDANGCFPDETRDWIDWRYKIRDLTFYVIVFDDGEYSIYVHSGVSGETQYTFTEFITKFAK